MRRGHHPRVWPRRLLADGIVHAADVVPDMSGLPVGHEPVDFRDGAVPACEHTMWTGRALELGFVSWLDGAEVTCLMCLVAGAR